jgi:hypothetical protein
MRAWLFLAMPGADSHTSTSTSAHTWDTPTPMWVTMFDVGITVFDLANTYTQIQTYTDPNIKQTDMSLSMSIGKIQNIDDGR